MQITGKTKLLGIIGDPVEHSLSPVIQNQAIKAKNLDYIYVPFPVQKEKALPIICDASSSEHAVAIGYTTPAGSLRGNPS